MISLWEAKTDAPNEFDRRENIGLHHLALTVDSFDRLDAVHENIKEHGIKVEFAPELLREGPTKHMMCYEPSGIRIEFIYIAKFSIH